MSGCKRRQLVEGDLAGQQVRVLVVDRLDAQQGEVALVLLRRADLARNRGPRLQPEAANLAGRNVDVVGAGEIVVVGAAEEAEPVGQDLQRPLAVHQPVELHPLLENPEDQVLLLDAGVIGEVFLAGLLDQLGHRHPLQFGDVGVARLLDLLVAVVDFVAARPAFGGDFLGQGEGLFPLQGPNRLVDRRARAVRRPRRAARVPGSRFRVSFVGVHARAAPEKIDVPARGRRRRRDRYLN